MEEDLIAKLRIKKLNIADIDLLVSNFAKVGWHKPKEIFEQYLQEQHEDKRLIWVAYLDDQIAGYITLVWQSKYLSFYKDQIPEIKDLNVLPSFRNLGIGLKLLKTAENTAQQKSNIIGIGVGLYAGYAAAHRLYIKNGYIPDGQGIAYNDQTLNFGAETILDDNLVLFFTKKIKYKFMSALKDLITLEKDARDYGFDWSDYEMILEQVIDECREIKEAINDGESKERVQEEIGDLLHTAISLCRFLEFNVEETLNKTSTKFAKRMEAVKTLTKKHNLPNLQGQSAEFLLKLWREAKEINKKE